MLVDISLILTTSELSHMFLENLAKNIHLELGHLFGHLTRLVSMVEETIIITLEPTLGTIHWVHIIQDDQEYAQEQNGKLLMRKHLAEFEPFTPNFPFL